MDEIPSLLVSTSRIGELRPPLNPDMISKRCDRVGAIGGRSGGCCVVLDDMALFCILSSPVSGLTAATGPPLWPTWMISNGRPVIDRFRIIDKSNKVD